MNTTIDFKTAKTIENMSRKIDGMERAVSGFFNKMSDIAERKYGDPQVYLAAVGPARDLSAILLEEAPGILPCFDETDDTFGISKELPVAGCYNPKQVLELSGKRYLTGPVVFVRFNMEGEYAKLLVARRKDFETANRKKFCARIATGDYDAVIIGHSQFERIPLSFERQERIIQEQIDEIQDAISELKYASGERFTVKQMEKSRKNLEQKLEKLRAADRKDDVITFEQLGVDRLFVDESHAFKNLFLYTKMRNVAGLSTSEAQKSSDMFGKCRYLDEVTGGRGVIFATGTPVSNSMTELYTVTE